MIGADLEDRQPDYEEEDGVEQCGAFVHRVMGVGRMVMATGFNCF